MIDADFLEKLNELTSTNTDIRIVDVTAAPGPEAFIGRVYGMDVPQGRKFEDLTAKLLQTLPNPLSRTGTQTLLGLDSFAAYVNRYKLPNSALYAEQGTNGNAPKLVAIFDEHDAVNVPAPLDKATIVEMRAAHDALNDDAAEDEQEPFVLPTVYTSTDNPRPQWRRFRAEYHFPAHDAFKAWSTQNKQPLSQSTLAEWIEDHITDVMDISTADQIKAVKTRDLIGQLNLSLGNRLQLLTAARGMAVKVTESVRSAVNTNDGSITVAYEQNHEAASKDPDLKIPTAFVIALPVFEGGAVFQLLTRLKYRKEGQTLKWSFDVYNLKRAVDVAFTSACDDVVTATGLPLYYAKV